MDRYPEIDERVRVHKVTLPKELQKHNTGKVIERDGEYIYIQLDETAVVVERYTSEIDSIETVH